MQVIKKKILDPEEKEIVFNLWNSQCSVNCLVLYAKSYNRGTYQIPL